MAKVARKTINVSTVLKMANSDPAAENTTAEEREAVADAADDPKELEYGINGKKGYIMKKYEFTGATKRVRGLTLHQIIAVRDFGFIKKGDLGGWIEKESNLSHDGDCWVFNDALVYGNSIIYGNAQVFGNAQVYDNTRVYGNSRVFGNACVLGKTRVYGNSRVKAIVAPDHSSSVGDIFEKDGKYYMVGTFGFAEIEV